MTHVIRRGGDVLVEATEVRVFAKRVPGERARIEAAPVPEFVRDRCA